MKKKRWGNKYIKIERLEAVYEKLVKRGEYYVNPHFLDTWLDEIKKMNHRKVGQPFLYPTSMIDFLTIFKSKGFDYRFVARDYFTIVEERDELSEKPEVEPKRDDKYTIPKLQQKFGDALHYTGFGMFRDLEEYIRDCWLGENGGETLLWEINQRKFGCRSYRYLNKLLSNLGFPT